jgi:uncharacterized protein YbgA (DUF1722 family)/uncharacterized protein YbbK (DUF523 family)
MDIKTEEKDIAPAIDPAVRPVIDPIIGMGACIAGEPVRYNGDSKRGNNQVNLLDQHFTLRTFCPEVGIGLGVPRETIRLVGDVDAPRAMDSSTQTNDYTLKLQRYAAHVLDQEPDMCAYLLVKGSPSCGFERVKRYNEAGNAMGRDARGIFAAALHKLDPLLPLEDDGRLHDAPLRESFVCRAMVYHDWKTTVKQGLSKKILINFYSRHKYLLMAHDHNTYKQAGKLLATSGQQSLDSLSAELIRLVMQGLGKTASRGSHANTLQHVMGYLKRAVSSRERQQLADTIEQYQQGSIPLVVPITLLRHHFSNHPDAYIDQQSFLQPYPDPLQLRNLI